MSDNPVDLTRKKFLRPKKDMMSPPPESEGVVISSSMISTATTPFSGASTMNNFFTTTAGSFVTSSMTPMTLDATGSIAHTELPMTTQWIMSRLSRSHSKGKYRYATNETCPFCGRRYLSFRLTLGCGCINDFPLGRSFSSFFQSKTEISRIRRDPLRDIPVLMSGDHGLKMLRKPSHLKAVHGIDFDMRFSIYN